jgi:SAM-dependent methyltransferase
MNFFRLLSHVYYAFTQLLWGVYDQTHYHVGAMIRYAKNLEFRVAFEIIVYFFQSILWHFLAHLAHHRFLHKIGFESSSDLIDAGTLVWRPIESSGNVLKSTNKPAKCVTGLIGNASGNHAHLSLASLSIEMMWSALQKNVPGFSYQNSVFIDFGCGTGLVVLAAMTHPFRRVIGVELDGPTSELGCKNVKKFASGPQAAMIRCADVRVEHVDMADFDFAAASRADTGTADDDLGRIADAMPSMDSMLSQESMVGAKTLVLYMYEPLWTLAWPDAHEIYLRILGRAQQQAEEAATCEVLVVYFYCGDFTGNALPALAELGAPCMHRAKYWSLEFGVGGDMYVYRLTKGGRN